MSSQRKITHPQLTHAERLALAMGKRLQKIAGEDLRNKLKSGEIEMVNGRYIGECLRVNRPPRRSAQA